MTLLNRLRMESGPFRASSLVLALFCAGFLALASCGGGGGGSSGGGSGGGGGGNPPPTNQPTPPPTSQPTPPPTSQPTPPPTSQPTPPPTNQPPPPPPPAQAAEFRSDEYRGLQDAASDDYENWALEATGAAEAYAAIAREERVPASTFTAGRGIQIAVIDSGIGDHGEFGAAVVEDTETLGGTGDSSGPNPVDSRGTEVVSVISAQPGNTGGPLVTAGMKDTRTHNFHGIAWGAQVKVFSAPLDFSRLSPGTDQVSFYTPISIPNLKTGESQLDGWIGDVLTDSPSTRIINMSLHYPGLVEYYLDPTRRSRLETELREAIRIREQPGRAAADRTLIVASAGNDHGQDCAPRNSGSCDADGKLEATSPTINAGLQVFFPDALGHVVTVVATGRDGNIAETSNRCGLAAKWCIAAPGEDILVAWFNPGTTPGASGDRAYTKVDGTFYAAPYVTGGLALLMQRFPTMRNAEILQRLYITADRSGDAAPNNPADTGGQCPSHLDTDNDETTCELSSIYGWGRMDLNQATMEWGVTTIALGDTLYDRRVPVASSGFRGGAAFGNALATGLRERTITVFDELDAPFRVDLDRFAAPAAVPAIGTRLARFLEPETEFHETGDDVRVALRPGTAGGLVDMPLASARLRFGLNHPGWEGPDSAWTTGHASLVPLADGGASLAFRNRALQFSAFATSPKFADAGQGPPRTAGAMLSWNPANGPLGLRVASLHEFESSLGLEAEGAFGEFASDLAFAGVELRAEAGGWEWLAAAEFGHSTPKVSPGSVQEISGLVSSAFSVSGERGFQNGGRLHLSVARPLRVERGSLRLRVATGRDKQRNVQYESVDTSLVPSGRQLDLGATWHQPLGPEGGELRLGSVLSLEPGHEAGRSPELALMAGYRLSF